MKEGEQSPVLIGITDMSRISKVDLSEMVNYYKTLQDIISVLFSFYFLFSEHVCSPTPFITFFIQRNINRMKTIY